MTWQTIILSKPKRVRVDSVDQWISGCFDSSLFWTMIGITGSTIKAFSLFYSAINLF